MNQNLKNLLKTICAILLVAAVIVGAFHYGNKQHQTADKKNEQKQTQSQQPAIISTPNRSAAPSVKNKSNVPINTDQSIPTSTPATGGEIYYVAPTAIMVGLYLRQRAVAKALHQANLE